MYSQPSLRWRWLRLYPCISSLLATPHSIWATLVTQSRLFRLLSWQANYPQAFPHVTSDPHSLVPTSTSPSQCNWHHLRHQSPLPRGPKVPTRLHSVLVAPVFLDFLNCETICYLMWMELLIFLGYFLLVCLFKKGDAPAGFVRRGCAFWFVVVLSCSCWPYYFNWVVAIKP